MKPTYLDAKGSAHNHGKHSKGLDSKDLGSKKASGNLETWQVIRCIKWDASCFDWSQVGYHGSITQIPLHPLTKV